jgi:hypothetical protein
MIFEKRGRWCYRDPAGKLHKFVTEAAAKASVAGSAPDMGIPEMDDNDYFECGECECDPCDCGMLDDELEEEDEDEENA